MSVLDTIFAEPASEWPIPSTNPSEPEKHLSAAQINMFRRCPEQFRRRYLLGEKERPNVNLIWGGADSKAAEVNFSQKITSGEDLPVQDLELAFAEAFDQKVEDSGGVSEVNWLKTTAGETKDRGVKLAAAYHVQVAPSVQPIAVEDRFVLELPGVPVPIVGFLDVEEEAQTIERKTSAAMSRVIKPAWQLQARIYRLAIGKPVSFHVSAKTKDPAVYTPDEMPGLRLAASLPSDYATVSLLQIVATQIMGLWYLYGPHQPWPDAVHTDACGWCGWRPTCSWWAE